jgi:tRNA (cmo5U34)-methyltransferase
MKSSSDEIRRRFDLDVERFSNLATGQEATVDAALALELVTEAAAAANPNARTVLDVGCGAGNYTLKLLERLPGLEVTLIDLSKPMLERARDRVRQAASAPITCIQGDIRTVELGEGSFDIVLAAAVLHHLRSDEEWSAVFGKLHAALRGGGSIWIFDLVESEIPQVEAMMRERYAADLRARKGEDYRRQVFASIEKEDTPRSLVYQLDLLRRVGFAAVEVLHKSTCFAAFGGMRPPGIQRAARGA